MVERCWKKKALLRRVLVWLWLCVRRLCVALASCSCSNDDCLHFSCAVALKARSSAEQSTGHTEPCLLPSKRCSVLPQGTCVWLSNTEQRAPKCDLYWPLRKHIDGTFGPALATAHDEALKAADALREAARSSSDVNEAQRLRLYAYYRVLAALDARLSLTEAGVRLDFAWSPAWSKSKAVKLYEGAYERAAILWNAGLCAAALCLVAAKNQTLTHARRSR